MINKSLPLFVFLSLFASAINYFSYPALARLLPPEQYVDITVSLSILTQIGTFMSALTAVTIGLSKQTHTDPEIITRKLQNSLLQIFILLGFVFLIFSPYIMSSVHTPALYAIPITIMIIVSIPVTIMSGYLNGRRQMIRLGLVALTTAFMQFASGAIVAAVSNNGVLAMTVMGISQIVAVYVLFLLFRDPQLPIIRPDAFKLEKYTPETRSLLIYTIVAAIGVMILNVLQIFDLLLVQSIQGDITKFYTDIYVISRIVFFAGMIFIWPFLGEISLTNKRTNLHAYMKLFSVFTLIGTGAICMLYFFGDSVTSILFGRHYSPELIRSVLVLSVLYKVSFLAITASALFLIVHRSKHIITLTLVVVTVIGVAALLSDSNNMHSILLGLTIASIVSFIFSATLPLLVHRPRL